MRTEHAVWIAGIGRNNPPTNKSYIEPFQLIYYELNRIEQRRNGVHHLACNRKQNTKENTILCPLKLSIPTYLLNPSVNCDWKSLIILLKQTTKQPNTLKHSFPYIHFKSYTYSLESFFL